MKPNDIGLNFESMNGVMSKHARSITSSLNDAMGEKWSDEVIYLFLSSVICYFGIVS